jgi:AcrR family transcriptional regulator
VRAPHIIDLQRSRILRAAVQEASERGAEQTPVEAIVVGAGVSRKTFYDLFANREDCMLAVFEHAVAMAAQAAVPAYEAQRGWARAMRAALAALLALMESERELASLALEYLGGGFARRPEHRARVLERASAVVDEGRLLAKHGSELSPLTAEMVVGGALAVVGPRVRAGAPLMELVSPLMWMIVVPYLGAAAAARELRKPAPKPAPNSAVATRAEPVRDALDGLDMRMTSRTASVLAAVAERRGRNNVEIGERAGISDHGQMSKLLWRLEGLGLIENTGGGHARGEANAWHLTAHGRRVERAFGRALGWAHVGGSDLPTAMLPNGAHKAEGQAGA